MSLADPTSSPPVTPPPLGKWRRRLRRLLALSVVTYLAAAALASSGPPELAGLLAFALAAGLAFRAGDSPASEAVPLMGTGLALASVVHGAGAPLFVRVIGDAGLVVALVVAARDVLALSGTPSLASALAPPRPWAAALPAGFVLVALLLGGRSELSVAVALTLAGALVVALVLFELGRRRLELGVRARHTATLAALLLGLGVAAAFSRAAPSGFTDVVLRAALAPAALGVVAIARRARELVVARLARLLVVVVVFGGALVLFALDVAVRSPLDAVPLVALTAAGGVLIGVLAPRIAEGLRPERGAWLDAVRAAEDALLRDGETDGVSEALAHLRAPLGSVAGPAATPTSPELWTFDPVRVLKVDAAGYAHASEGLYPADVVRFAAEEPEATLRAEVLAELEVRRPDLRPALRWLRDRDAKVAVVITEGGEPRGLLVVPEGPRHDALTLEEVVALKRLADRFAGISGFRAATARGLERERALRERIDGLEDRLATLEHAAAREAARHERATLRLARPATVGLYAASSRLAFEALEARTRVGAPLVVEHPSGVDPVPYVARAHLSGARAKGALVLVDGTAAREHEVARWTDPIASPLALADRGVLVLVDGAALPVDVQRLVAQSLAEKRAPWERAEPLDVVLALTRVPGEPSIEPALAARLGDAIEQPVRLPGLAERAEDLRALLTDRLAREGLRVRGEPVALGDSALARLVEHPFPGDELELAAVVQALVRGARGAVLTGEDVDRLGLRAEPPPDARIRLV